MTAAGRAWGFFNRLVAPEQLQEAALQLAQEIASGPTRAHAMTKQMLHAEWHLPIDAAIDARRRHRPGACRPRIFQRAYRAFAAKQKPQFEGN
jgi:enoyl-CoA hydratase/carnithine racemase